MGATGGTAGTTSTVAPTPLLTSAQTGLDTAVPDGMSTVGVQTVIPGVVITHGGGGATVPTHTSFGFVSGFTSSFFGGGGGVSGGLLKSATFQSAFTSPLLLSL